MLGLLINLPFIVALIFTVVVWRTIRHQFLFLIAAALSLLGLQNLIAPVSISKRSPDAMK